MEAEVINAIVNSPNTIEILLRASGPLFGLLVLIGVFLIAHKYIPQLISSFNGLTSEVKLMRETLSKCGNNNKKIRCNRNDLKKNK